MDWSLAKQLYEPNLLVPGRRPTGAVKYDYAPWRNIEGYMPHVRSISSTDCLTRAPITFYGVGDYNHKGLEGDGTSVYTTTSGLLSGSYWNSTFLVRFKPKPGSYSTDKRLFSCVNESLSPTNFVDMYWDADGTGYVSARTRGANNSVQVATSTVAATEDAYNWAALVQTAGNLSFILNGSTYSAGYNSTITFQGDEDFYTGALSGPTQYWNGDIDYLMVFKESKSVAQLQRIIADPFAPLIPTANIPFSLKAVVAPPTGAIPPFTQHFRNQRFF